MSDAQFDPASYDPSDPTAPTSGGQAGQQPAQDTSAVSGLNFSDPNSHATVAAVNQRINAAAESSHQVSKLLTDSIPVLQDLHNQHSAIDQTFLDSVTKLGREQDDAYEKKTRAASLPSGIANLVGMFDSDYSEHKQDTRIAAAGSKMATAKLQHEASSDILAQKADSLTQKITLSHEVAQLESQTTQNIIQGWSALQTVAEKKRENNIATLSSISAPELSKFMKTPGQQVTINGQQYDKGEVSLAYEKRATRDLTLSKLSADAQLAGASATKVQLENTQNQLNQFVQTLSPTEIGNFLNSSKNGLITFNYTGPDGKVSKLAVPMEAFGAAAKTNLSARSEVNAKFAQMNDITGQIGQLAGENKSNANVMRTMIGNDHTLAPLLADIGQKSSLIENAYKDIATRANDPKYSITASDANLLAPAARQQYKGVIDAHKVQLADAQKRIADTLDPIQKQAFNERVTNLGELQSDGTARSVLNQSLYKTEGFGLAYQDVSPALHNAVEDFMGRGVTAYQSLKGQKGSGANAPDLVSSMATIPELKNDPELAWIAADKSIKGSDFNKVFIGSDLSTLTKTSLKLVQDQLDGVGQSKALESIITKDGQYTPQFDRLVRQYGPLSALSHALAQQDAEASANGTDNSLDPVGYQIMRTMNNVVNNWAQGYRRTTTLPGVKEPIPGLNAVGLMPADQLTTSEAAVRKIVYDNKPQAILPQYFARAASNYKAIMADEYQKKAAALTTGDTTAMQQAGAALSGTSLPSGGTIPAQQQALEARRKALGLDAWR